MLARGEDRGLGLQTWEWYRHVQPDRTLLIHMGPLAGPFVCHADRYPDATTVRYDGALPEAECRTWLRGLDVVYTAETFYDWRFVEWAREAGTATVCHINPEFYRHGREPALPRPDVWWAPTSWRLDALDPATRIVPVPVALDRFGLLANTERDPGPLRWLHLAGHRAALDRNGTILVFQALRFLREPQHVTIRTQDPTLPRVRHPAHVTVDALHASTVDYWRVYDHHDALVLPRRYGGLCLPVLEASGAGMAVLMPDLDPQRHDWPHVGLTTVRPGRQFDTPAGRLRTWDALPQRLAETMDRWARDPDTVTTRRDESRRWAAANSWDALHQVIVGELERACR